MGSAGSTQYKAPAEIESKVYPDFKNNLSRMDGMVVAVTGCTTGTGYICAKTCAELGAQVIMLNRVSERHDTAFRMLKQEVPGAKVTFITCDLTSFDSVRRAGAELRRLLSRSGLDVLVNNAGIMAVKDEATADGFDTQMQVNHLSHFLLTAEVWPLLEQAAARNGEARIVNHTSEGRRGKHLDPEYMGKNGGNLGGDERGWTPLSGARWERYQQTKLANVIFTYALNDRIKASESKVKVLVAHPGMAATNLQVTTAKNGGMGQGFADWLMRHGSQSAEDGAVGLLTCCCAKKLESGQFWGPSGFSGPAFSGPAVLLPEDSIADAASRTMLWADSNWATRAQFNP